MFQSIFGDMTHLDHPWSILGFNVHVASGPWHQALQESALGHCRCWQKHKRVTGLEHPGVDIMNPYSPSFYRSAKKKSSTLTKVTIRRFTSMLVAMGGGKLQICVLWIWALFVFLASSFCHEFPGNPGHLLINVEILFFFKIKLGMPPFPNNQRLERITYIEICYLK